MADKQPDLPTPPKGARIPPEAVAAAYAPRAAGEDDASAEANAKVAADIAANASRPIPAEQLVTQPVGMEGTRAMWVIVGPYRHTVLTMPDAEAEDAKDSHWAINMSDIPSSFDAENNPLVDHDHELTDEDRAYAIEAANAWAQAQADPEEPDEPAPEGETGDARREREMRNEGRQKRNTERQAKRKPQRNETDEQRQAREKRNSDHNQRAMQGGAPAGNYETRAPGRLARPQPKT
jgi:hypothetical protein